KGGWPGIRPSISLLVMQLIESVFSTLFGREIKSRRILGRGGRSLGGTAEGSLQRPSWSTNAWVRFMLPNGGPAVVKRWRDNSGYPAQQSSFRNSSATVQSASLLERKPLSHRRL